MYTVSISWIFSKIYFFANNTLNLNYVSHFIIMRKFSFLIVLFNLSLLLSQSSADSLYIEFNNTLSDSIRVEILQKIYTEYKYKFPEKAKGVIHTAFNIMKNGNNNYLRAKIYNLKADYFQSQSEYDSATIFFEEGLKFSKTINYNTGISEALIGLGNTYWRKGNFPKALEYQNLNLQNAQLLTDEESIARSYNNIGNIYNDLGEYTKAMENYTLSSEKFKELGNQKSFSITLGNIGIIHWKLKNFEAAKNYLALSDSIFKKIDYERGRAFVLKNLAIISLETDDIKQSIKYNLDAMESYREMGRMHEITQILSVLGNIYSKQKKYQQAISYYVKALDITKQIGDSSGIATSYKFLGDCYFKINDINKAKLYSNKAIQIAKIQGKPLTVMAAYKTLSKVYAEEENYKEAYESMDKYTILKDTLYTKEKRELATDIEAKYQNKQKAKEIEFLASENNIKELQIDKRENERNTIIAFAIILLLLAGLLYNQYRIKQKANKKLKELDKLKSNFFANISHEFRTPLTLIKGPIEQIEQNPDEILSTDDIGMIKQNTNRLLKLVNQLLDLSKIDDDNMRLDITEGDIYKCLRTAASSFNSHAAQRSIDYRLQVPQTILWTSFDRDKLEKIVYNLLSNAFKFSDDGDVVSVEVKYEKENFQLQVGDTGKGISEDKVPFIFDRFYQVDGSYTKEREGSGIGLSLTKDLVELMGGTITVSSEKEKGSFFTVQIPILEIKTRRKPESIVSTNPKSEIDIEKPYNFQKADTRNVPVVLLIEDNGDMRQFIRKQLIGNYKVKEAFDGEAGLNEAITTLPDLIITDLMMPKMDGIELCKELKTNINTSHIPIIMLTAKAGIENKIEGLETGADDYLTKPFDANELLIRVKNLITQRQKLRELFAEKRIQISPKKVAVMSIDQKFMEQVLELLENNFSDANFGVPRMQKVLVMSKTQLHRKLKALTNEAPGELLRNFRLKKGAQFISQNTDNVTQIAYEVGFNNPSYFTKCFKGLYGVSPSSYYSQKNNS